MDKKRIASLMKNLHCTKAEAIAVIEQDAAIDKGEKLFELNSEQKKAAKKATITGTRSATGTIKRVRTIDENKKNILQIFIQALEKANIPVSSIKNETEVTFSADGNDYTLKLIKHRKK